MGKADQKKVDKAINTEEGRSLNESRQGIGDTQSRVNQLIPRSDTERNSVFSGYSDLAKGGREDMSNFLLSGSPSASGGGGGGGGSSTMGGPSYLDTFRELSGSQGGFDPSRLGRIEGITGRLGDTSGNYGDVNKSIGSLQNTRGNYGATDTSISGLQKFAAAGGLDPGDLERINRPLFEEFERTGGYSDEDRANIRNRSNATIPGIYAAQRDELKRNQIASGQMGPGWSEAGFKLARQGAQGAATNARDTELGISDAVRTGRMDAAKTIAGNQLALQPIKNAATLGGYGAAGQLDISRNQAIDAAMEAAGRMGLTRQQQIDAAMEASAGIEQGNQGLINQTRLSAAGGLSQDELGRMSIGASAGANNAALDAMNKRFLIEQEQQNKATGLGGMLSTYGAAPSELLANQGMLRDYRGDAVGQQQGLIGQRIQRGYMPGIGSSISQGLKIAGQVAALGSGVGGGLASFGGNKMNAPPQQINPYMFPGYRSVGT